LQSSGYWQRICSEIFLNKYGKVKRQDRPSSEEYDYMWKHGEVLINLNYLGIQDEGKIRYYYIPIWDQMGKDEKSQY
jgi:hypothetical protein